MGMSEHEITKLDQRDPAKLKVGNEHLDGPQQVMSRAEKGEVIGGGYIIAHRNTNGRIRTSKMPFEHPTQAAALDEATRLSEKHPGRTYVILAVVGTVLNDKVK